MKSVVLVCLTALSILTSSFNAQAASDEEMWQSLQKAAIAARALNYQGIFVCQKGNQSRSVQITHLFNGQGEFARNVILDTAPREVLSQGGDLVIYNPKNEKVIIERRRGRNMFPAVLPANLEPIKASYAVRLGDVETVAGRQAQILFLDTRDNYRYSYQFWIDSEFGMLLKSALLNQRNQVIETMAFNQLSMMNSLNLDWFKPTFNSNKNYVMEDEVPVVANGSSANWVVKDLPPGFRKIDQVTRIEHNRTTPVTQLVFSDGLASVSLFIEPMPKLADSKPVSKGLHGMVGNANFYVSAINGYRVTALGEVPEVTVAQIANAIVFNK